MKIDHLILFTNNVEASTNFFCEIFGFQATDDDPGAKDGKVIHSDQSDIVILGASADRLPNPYHFAFEASSLKEFQSINEVAVARGLAPRTMPAKDSTPGIGSLARSDRTLSHFYVDAPSGTLVEVLYRS